ncbi:MAG: hypothetical protein R2716_08415 [Microthrixaceae bacterium]
MNLDREGAPDEAGTRRRPGRAPAGILDHTLRDLRYEIVATDKVAYKRELVEREETIKSLLEPLGGPLPDQA